MNLYWPSDKNHLFIYFETAGFSRFIDIPFMSEMDNSHPFQQKSKSVGQFFKTEKFWKNYMCAYLGRTGYFTAILYCWQWGNF